MKTYAIRGARTKSTGHLRQDGTRTTYCNRPVGIPNGDFMGLTGWKMCQPCVKAEARDRAAATATATAALTLATVGALPALICVTHGPDCDDNPKRRHEFRTAPKKPIVLTEWERDLLAADVTPTPRYTTADENAASSDHTAPYPIETYHRLYCTTHGEYHPCDRPSRIHDYMHCAVTDDDRARITAGDTPPWCYSTHDDNPPAAVQALDADRAAAAEEFRQAAELVTEAEATAGTWRGAWIGDTTALFDRPVEQGALFA